MTEKMDNFANRCKKLPSRLKEWDAFTQLRLAGFDVVKIRDFSTIVPERPLVSLALTRLFHVACVDGPEC